MTNPLNALTVQELLNIAKENAKRKARQMAALELSVWDKKHEQDLKRYYGFTGKKLADRKRELIAAAK